ncbi:MAG: hypothetical protein ACP5OR_01705 [Candidatus Dormibacteria bacterium]
MSPIEFISANITDRTMRAAAESDLPSNDACGSQRKRLLTFERVGEPEVRDLAEGSAVVLQSSHYYRGIGTSCHVAVQLTPSGDLVCVAYRRKFGREEIQLVYCGSSVGDAIEAGNTAIVSLEKEGYVPQGSRTSPWFSERAARSAMRTMATGASPYAPAAQKCLRNTERSGIDL